MLTQYEINSANEIKVAPMLPRQDYCGSNLLVILWNPVDLVVWTKSRMRSLMSAPTISPHTWTTSQQS